MSLLLPELIPGGFSLFRQKCQKRIRRHTPDRSSERLKGVSPVQVLRRLQVVVSQQRGERGGTYSSWHMIGNSLEKVVAAVQHIERRRHLPIWQYE